MNSWCMRKDSDNCKLRQQVIDYCNLDLIGICETYLRAGESLEGYLKHFRWFGNNRKNVHVNARSGSGGVGLFVKETVLSAFDVNVLDENCEDILWVKLSARNFDCTLLICVCYLPPARSSRYVNASEFYNNLLGQIYKFQGDGIVCVMGDFNSRCGDLEDFIEGVDNIPTRQVVDHVTNEYGEFLCDMLISANMCMLNGRSRSNNFTCKGASVVDYALVLHEQLKYFENFSVVDSQLLFEEAGCVGSFDPLRSIPDHSMLQWLFNLADFCPIDDGTPSNNSVNVEKRVTKFKLTDLPDIFMNNEKCESLVSEKVAQLQQDEVTNKQISDIYQDFCHIVNQEMSDKLECKHIVLGRDVNKRKKHV